MRKISIIGLIALALLTGCSLLSFVDLTGNRNVAAAAITPAPTPTPVTTASPQALDAMNAIQQGLAAVYQQVSPSVVNVRVAKVTEITPSSMLPFPFQTPGQGPQEYRQSGLGSGFVWDKEGHIVTNNHVVDGAEQITVTFWDGSSAEARLVGADADSDLAVIQVDVPAERLRPIQVADSTQVQVGQMVAAIGNPFGLEGTMTTGIISALGRSLPVESGAPQGGTYTIPDVIQTDAPINPGNSGGVLVDIHGRLLGVTTAIESPVRANAGIGFVIPSIIVQRVVPELIANGYYNHPYIGISGTTLTTALAEAMGLDGEQHGALVVEVVPDSPADKAGLRGSDRTTEINGQQVRIGGDIIIQIDDYPVTDFEDLTAYLARYTEAGQQVTLTVVRDGKTITLSLTLGVRPTSQGKEQSAGAETGKGVWLGIVGTDLTPEIAEAMGLERDQQGVLIQQVITGSPADKAGLRGSYKSAQIQGQSILIGGDVITSLNQQETDSLSTLKRLLRAHHAGESINLGILRGGMFMEIVVQLEAKP